MVAMNVSLTPELSSFVRAQVEGGQYGSSSEVVRDALRLFQERLDKRAAELEWLRAEIQKGIDSGPAELMDFESLWSEAREEFRNSRPAH